MGAVPPNCILVTVEDRPVTASRLLLWPQLNDRMPAMHVYHSTDVLLRALINVMGFALGMA